MSEDAKAYAAFLGAMAVLAFCVLAIMRGCAAYHASAISACHHYCEPFGVEVADDSGCRCNPPTPPDAGPPADK